MLTTIAYDDGPGADPVKNALDLYGPEGGTGLPVLLFFHGGVWQRGDKNEYRNIGEALAQREILTAVVNYRLTPAVRHPQHVRDAARATAWAVRHAPAYGGRPDRVFLSGHSAGGHLITLLLFDPQYLRAEGLEPEILAGVIPLSGIFDLTRPIDDTPEGGFARHIFPPFGEQPRVLEAASPVRHLHPTRVPILVVLAGNDYTDMQGQSRLFVEALQERRISVKFETIPGRGHFELVQAIGRENDPAAEIITQFVLSEARERRQ